MSGRSAARRNRRRSRPRGHNVISRHRGFSKRDIAKVRSQLDRDRRRGSEEEPSE